MASLSRRRTQVPIPAPKKTLKLQLLLFVPGDDSKRRLEQMASFTTALSATKTEFSNELNYMPGMAPWDANSPAPERGGMQVVN
jgi:[histone H3]-lysine27 N-methyltransferase